MNKDSETTAGVSEKCRFCQMVKGAMTGSAKQQACIHSFSKDSETKGCPLRVHQYGVNDRLPLCPVGNCTHILLPEEETCPCHTPPETKEEQEKHPQWPPNCIYCKKPVDVNGIDKDLWGYYFPGHCFHNKCHHEKVTPSETSSWNTEFDAILEKIRKACNNNGLAEHWAVSSIVMKPVLEDFIRSVATSEYKRGVEDGRKETGITIKSTEV